MIEFGFWTFHSLTEINLNSFDFNKYEDPCEWSLASILLSWSTLNIWFDKSKILKIKLKQNHKDQNGSPEGQTLPLM